MMDTIRPLPVISTVQVVNKIFSVCGLISVSGA